MTDFERSMAALDEAIATIHTREIPPEMLDLAEEALAAMDARRDEDVTVWAQRLAASLCADAERDPPTTLRREP